MTLNVYSDIQQTSFVSFKLITENFLMKTWNVHHVERVM